MGSQSKAKEQRRLRRKAFEAQAAARQHEVEKVFDDFEALLARHGAKIRCGSKLEQALLLAKLVRYVREEGAEPPYLPPDEEDAMFRRVSWLWGTAPRILQAEKHDDFGQLVPHLRLVVESEFAQNNPGKQDEGSDKLFEFSVALAILPGARKLRMDTGASAGTNPDLLFDFRGARWGIACKALYSTKPERYRDSVIKGAEQIERSEAQRGVVCVSLRNIINQNLFMPRDGNLLGFLSSEYAREQLAKEEARFNSDFIEPMRRDIATDFARRRNVDKAVLHVSAVCARMGSPDDFRYTYLARILEAGKGDEPLVEALNAGLQPIQPPLPRVR